MTPHQAIAHYRITAKLGQGGMGEVWRATDTKLGREVAIKILPDAFAADPDRMARFQREAQVLGSLNHPNVGAIYGIERNALVMELVEGETLRGPLPIETAVRYARQIALALEAAHEKGIVHRDLKPSNIKVTPEGVVKLLDFGLAKAGEDIAGNPAASPTLSPTLSLAMTQAGVILGTAAYMAPEQARGKAVDKRADIWAFGLILYEMLTGRRPYPDGETVTDTLAAVVLKEPEWEALPKDTPPRIRRLLERCLRKDPKQRLRDIGDARIILDEPEPAPAPAAAGRSTPRTWLFRAAVAALGAAAAGLGFGWWQAAHPAPRPPVRLDVSLGPTAVVGVLSTAILSPDGTRLVFHSLTANGTMNLSSRLLEKPAAATISGTDDVGDADPAFSPDGRWIAYSVDNRLKKVPVMGGAPIDLCETPGGSAGVSWGDRGTIVFASGHNGPIRRVSAEGGTPQPITDPVKSGDFAHWWPEILPGSREVLFTAPASLRDFDEAAIKAVSLETGEVRTIYTGGYGARYLPTGHLVFMHAGTLFAVRFDPDRLELRGTPVPVLEGIAASYGTGQFSISQTGTLVYLPGESESGKWPMLWMTAAGPGTPILSNQANYLAPAFSPDGKRLAYTVTSGKGSDVWVYDIARDTPTQLTFNAVRTGTEVAWAPDGRHLVYGARAGNHFALWWIRADGSGEPHKLLEGNNVLRPHSFSPDGRRLMYSANPGLPDLWTLPIEGANTDSPRPGTPEPFLITPNVEVDAMFSPDGHWVAYASNESGREEIFVRPFPPNSNGGGKVRVSIDGGKFPNWSRNGRELFFLGGDDRIMVADYTTKAGSFEVSKPRVWSEKPIYRTLVTRNLDLHPDGKRFAVFPRPAQSAAPGGAVHVTFILNFFDELKRRVP